MVDTTGAGDALAAGWIVGGPDLALEAAARCVQQVGAMPRLGVERVSELIVVGEEVRAALDAGDAVVALETTLVAHGFPAPDGVEVGLASEAAVREAGAVPATIGVLDGAIRVGLEPTELERFTADSRKTGPRDLAACAVQGAVGATTVGGALTVADWVGIPFLGTGGIGGVHRGFPSPPDVSADIPALARARALVVSSGVKSLLDVPATVELLETLGIPVLGFRTSTLPLFYAAEGGPPVPQRVEEARRGRPHRPRPLGARRRRSLARATAAREPGRRGPDRVGRVRRGRRRASRGRP